MRQASLLVISLLLTAASVQASAVDGKQLYTDAKCGQCHSLNGAGKKNRPLDFCLVTALNKGDPIENLKTVMKSHGPKPAKVRIPNRLSDEDFVGLVAFFRSVLPEYGPAPKGEDFTLLLRQRAECKIVGEPVRPFCPLSSYCGWSVTGLCPGTVTTRTSVISGQESVTQHSVKIDYAEQGLFFRYGRLVNLSALGSGDLFHHDATGITVKVAFVIDNAFRGWRREFYDSTRGFGYYLAAMLDKAGLRVTEDAAKAPALELNVRLVGIKIGAFGTRLPSMVRIHSILKRKSDSRVILETDTEGKGRARSLGELAVDRAISSMDRSLEDAASQVASEVIRAVVEKRP